MKYLKPYAIFESVNLLISNIDKYKPMIDLLSNFLQLVSSEDYKLSETEFPAQEAYKILHRFEGLFNDRNVKIGDVKYSLSAEGDNELNKLKEIKKIHIGHGESITINPDLYFEDLKFIDWLLYKVEQGDYHIKIEPGYWGYCETYLLSTSMLYSNNSESYEEYVIKNFKMILKMIEDFYHRFKHINLPNFTFEDIEDLLLLYIDNNTIQKLYVQGRVSKQKASDQLNYNYQVIFELILTSIGFDNIQIQNSFDSGVMTPEFRSTIDNKVYEIYQSCLSKCFVLVNYTQYAYRGSEDSEPVSYVTLNLIEK